MLSYKHGFHSGNHADIIKHMTICLLLRCLNKKEKPYTVIDTHSGSGVYIVLLSGFQPTRYGIPWLAQHDLGIPLFLSQSF